MHAVTNQANAAQRWHPSMTSPQQSGTESGSESSASDEGTMRGMTNKVLGMKFDGQQEAYTGPISGAMEAVRRGFIQKVYAILCAQLLLTFFIALPFNYPAFGPYIRQNVWLMYVAQIVAMGAIIGVACCCQQVARTVPYNYIFLLVVTVAMAILVGFYTSFYSITSVLLALATTIVVFLGLTAYACFTKTDFTGIGPYLYAALWSLIGFSFVITLMGLFFEIPPWVQIVFSFLGVILFSFYIVYDTQKIVGGTHAQQYGVDDYVFAALSLYLDIINLFMYILALFGGRK